MSERRLAQRTVDEAEAAVFVPLLLAVTAGTAIATGAWWVFT